MHKIAHQESVPEEDSRFDDYSENDIIDQNKLKLDLEANPFDVGKNDNEK